MNVMAVARFDKLRTSVTSTLNRSVYDNPVIVKEFRTRMRGWKAFAVMGAYALLMGTVMMVTYYFTAEDMRRGYSGMQSTQVTVGRDLFVALMWAQTILLTLIIPSLTAGALTQELEKKTIEMVALSPLTSGQMVIGKQLSSFLYAMILLVSSLPLSGICLMLGGISPAEIWVSYLLLIAWAFGLSCMGVMWSSLAKKTMTASGNTFGLSFLYLISTAIGGTAVQFASRYLGSSYGVSPFALLFPGWAPMAALSSTHICGVSVPLALVPVVLHVAYGVLFLLIASTHVRYKPGERALPIRLIVIGIAVFTAWLAAGSPTPRWMYGASGAAALGPIAISLLAYAVFAAAIFATGVVKKPEGKNMLQYALSGRKMFRSDIGGAISFVALLAAATFTTYGITLSRMAKTFRAASLPPMPPMHPAHALHSLTHSGFWTAYYRLAIPLIVMAAAFAAIGVLCSSLTKKRNSAAALVVLFAVVAFAGYGIISMNYQQISPSPSRSLSNLAVFWPLTPFLAVTDNWPQTDPAPLWLPHSWILCSLTYALIGAAALLLASGARRKTGGVVEEST